MSDRLEEVRKELEAFLKERGMTIEYTADLPARVWLELRDTDTGDELDLGSAIG